MKMEIDRETARALKHAVTHLFDSKEGQLLIEYLEELSGKYYPRYNPESQTSITLQAGMGEIVAILHNFNRMTDDQIVEYHKKG